MGATQELKPQLGGTAIKPVGWDRTGWESFKYLIYDPSTGAILTRTPMSWLKIVLFYVVYYTLLAGFWMACLHIFFLTIPLDQPRWMKEESLIGANPGVGLRPRQSDARIDSSIFVFRVEDNDQKGAKDGEGEANIDHATRMDLVMKTYTNKTGLHECPNKDEQNPGKCIFDTAILGDCAQSPYGYMPIGRKISPCLFLKLNKIFGMVPKPIHPSNLTDKAYDAMSQGLKDIITREGDTSNVYFDCRGRFPADTEMVKLTYFPANRAISNKYFPFMGGNYQSPLVAVKVEPMNVGQMLHIECRAWYEGVVHDTKDKIGLVQFEILAE